MPPVGIQLVQPCRIPLFIGISAESTTGK